MPHASSPPRSASYRRRFVGSLADQRRHRANARSPHAKPCALNRQPPHPGCAWTTPASFGSCARILIAQVECSTARGPLTDPNVFQCRTARPHGAFEPALGRFGATGPLVILRAAGLGRADAPADHSAVNLLAVAGAWHPCPLRRAVGPPPSPARSRAASDRPLLAARVRAPGKRRRLRLSLCPPRRRRFLDTRFPVV